MSVFELSTRLSSFNRKKGASAVAKAAYRAGVVISCEREQKTHDYSRKSGVELAAIVLPAGSPEWARDRAKLWNAAEYAERNKDKRAKSVWRENAVVAREWLFTLPHELSKAGRERAARAVAEHLVQNHGVAVDFAIHESVKDGDERNWHVHMMMTSRRMTDAGLKGKTSEFRDDRKKAAALTKSLRKKTAEILNAQLQEEGHKTRVEWESFKARGVGRTPTRHQGPARTHIMRKKLRREREQWVEKVSGEQKDKHDKEAAELDTRQRKEIERKKAELRERHRAFVAKLKSELQAARQADPPVSGIKRTALKLSGMLERVEAARAERHKQRIEAASERVQAMRKALEMEGRALRGRHQIEREDLRERHHAENRQLKQAIEARPSLDRARERQARQVIQVRSREQEHGQGRERTFAP